MRKVKDIVIKHDGAAWISETSIPQTATRSETRYVLEYKAAGSNCVEMLEWGNSVEEVISKARAIGL